MIPFEYKGYGSKFSEGLAAVRKNGKMGYIDAANQVVIPFEYDTAFCAGGGVGPVSKGGK